MHDDLIHWAGLIRESVNYLGTLMSVLLGLIWWELRKIRKRRIQVLIWQEVEEIRRRLNNINGTLGEIKMKGKL